MKAGDRAGALMGSDGGVLKIFGFGVYTGEAVPEEAVGWLAEMARECGRVNPRILLDNGSVVYGCECWWGPEAQIQDMISRFNGEVQNVDIEAVRKELKAQGE